jgi:hypothetical protein
MASEFLPFLWLSEESESFILKGAYGKGNHVTGLRFGNKPSTSETQTAYILISAM